jgi:glycosyltransferase involved in cell wall biosynthesis
VSTACITAHEAKDRTVAPRVSVVIPARNEARNLSHVLEALPAGLHEVILVDGHSLDGTVEVAQQCLPSIRVVRQTRKGKGNALACGFAEVTGDIVVMLDADGSADPSEIPAFVHALVAGGAQFAKGTRFAQGGSSSDITLFRRLGNAALNGLVNMMYSTRYTDLCYGYNAFWAHLLPALDLPAVRIDGLGTSDMTWGDGFEIETLINVRVALAGARITEVGSVEKRRLHGESNLNAVTDGLRVLRTIMAERRRQRRQQRLAADAPRGTVIDLPIGGDRESRSGDALPEATAS